MAEDKFGWLTIDGPAKSAPLGRASLRERLNALQQTYAERLPQWILGRREGCLDALWLAAQYDVGLLVLQEWPASFGDRLFRRVCERRLFAVVCDVIVLPERGARLPQLPNARVRVVSDAEQLVCAVEERLQAAAGRNRKCE